MSDTKEQFDRVIARCREVFERKLKDYGPSWRIMRPESVTDQIFIKANRIRNLEIKGIHRVDEGVKPEFIAIVNYGVVGLIQLEKGFADSVDITADEALNLYGKHIGEARTLMYAKNHDYGEAWRNMRISSYTDLILMKICRTKQIESNRGRTLASEGIDANYQDMINYALFGLIQLESAEQEMP
jgi:transcription initiation factor TFIIIB Brf1 subunit/transcription initiation factor TFIIB